jgi:FAD/FMN-containing dehydrogenase
MGEAKKGDQPLGRREFLAAAGVAGLSLALPAGADVADAARRTVGQRAAPILRARAAPISGLQRVMRGHVFVRGAPGFGGASHVYNERFDSVSPLAVARPINAADVQAAVRWAVSHGVPLRARSGGHSYAGYCTLSNGVVLDLRKMSGISVNQRAGTATIGAGAQLIDVYTGLSRRGATIPAGSCPSVGITGVTLGGGMGLAARSFGMTADNLVGAKIVTADGRLRTVNRNSNPNLLWALRGGGGGNFGVVTQLTFKIHKLPRSAAYFFVFWPWSEAANALEAWQNWAPHARDQLTSIFHLSGGGGAATVNVSGQYLGPSSDLSRLLAPLRAVGGASVQSGSMNYLSLQLLFAGCEHKSVAACHTVGAAAGGTLPRESFQAKSDYVSKPLPAAARNALAQAVENRAHQPGSGAILFDSYGGAINRVAPSATAFVHRRQLFCMQYLTYNGGGPWLSQIYGRMRPYVSGQAYQNYIDAQLRTWRQAYYGSNYGRLQSVRRSYDPHHFFNFPQAIGR